MKIKVRIEFKLQDLWIGVFWNTRFSYWENPLASPTYEDLDIWICILPCFPIHIRFRKVFDG